MRALKFFKIRYRLFMLGASDVCMPIDIFSLSNRLQELYPDERVQKVLNSYIHDESAFVRRVMLTAIRFIGEDFTKKNIGIVRDHLQDENEWVSYDAIWALSELGNLSKTDKNILSKYAQKYSSCNAKELQNVRPASAEEHRDKKAAEVLLLEPRT
jgi:hypothetical protein